MCVQFEVLGLVHRGPRLNTRPSLAQDVHMPHRSFVLALFKLVRNRFFCLAVGDEHGHVSGSIRDPLPYFAEGLFSNVQHLAGAKNIL